MMNRDPVTGSGELPRHGAADAARSTGDQDSPPAHDGGQGDVPGIGGQSCGMLGLGRW